MKEYVCTSKNAKISKGCIESHKFWILGIIVSLSQKGYTVGGKEEMRKQKQNIRNQII